MIASSLCNASAKFPAEVMEVETMMEQKRNLCSVDESSLTSLTSKRHKTDFSISSKERKDKLGERIIALQQLVSPYGKTDTASVLLEVMEYIQFLHEQVKVLSAPYLQSTPTVQLQELEAYDHSLRNRGLCLVPISWTAGVARSNGADIWAPVKTTSPNSKKPSHHSIDHKSLLSSQMVLEFLHTVGKKGNYLSSYLIYNNFPSEVAELYQII